MYDNKVKPYTLSIHLVLCVYVRILEITITRQSDKT